MKESLERGFIQFLHHGPILRGFNSIELKCFLLDVLLKQAEKSQSAFLFTHIWIQNGWIHAFTEVISMKPGIWIRVTDSISYDN